MLAGAGRWPALGAFACGDAASACSGRRSWRCADWQVCAPGRLAGAHACVCL